MPLIQCILGPAEPTVAGTTYSFQRDPYGRFVADVYNDRHVACFLAVEHYREVDKVPTPADPLPISEPEPPLDPEPPAPQVLEPVGEPAPGLGLLPPADPVEPPAQTEPPATPKPETAVDELTRIKGIGPSMKKALEAIGYTSLRQIASLTSEDATALDGLLNLKGRVTSWVEQAQLLVAGLPKESDPDKAEG